MHASKAWIASWITLVGIKLPYYYNNMMPLSKAVMGFLNPNQVASSILPSLQLPLISIMLFESIASTQETTENLLKVELSLFCKLNVEDVDGLDPLIWWSINESKFPNIGFLAR